MNKLHCFVAAAFSTGCLLAQTVTVFPDEYAAVPEGPHFSQTLPLAYGTSRVQCLYELVDLAIPSGDTITKLGFREDGTSTQLHPGVALQLEIRMAWSTETADSMSTTYDNNYAGTPVTVFGPALFVPPPLRDASAPLPNGQFFIPLTTPFSFVPNGRNLIVEYRIYGTASGGASFSYYLDRANFYSPVTYGAPGCQHSGGNSPNMTITPTVPGQQWRADIATGPANAPAFMAVNVGSPFAAPYPLTSVFGGISASCFGQMPLNDTVLLSGATTGQGNGSWQFTIPNDNQWGDMVISSQAIMLDFFSPGQVVVSNGGQVMTGIKPRSSIVYAAGAPTALTTGAKFKNYCPVAFFEHL